MTQPRALRLVSLAALAGGLLPISLCIDISGENFREFRQTAIPGLQSGLSSILNGALSGDSSGLSSGFGTLLGGVVDGFFEVLAPDVAAGAGTSTTSSP